MRCAVQLGAVILFAIFLTASAASVQGEEDGSNKTEKVSVRKKQVVEEKVLVKNKEIGKDAGAVKDRVNVRRRVRIPPKDRIRVHLKDRVKVKNKAVVKEKVNVTEVKNVTQEKSNVTMDTPLTAQEGDIVSVSESFVAQENAKLTTTTTTTTTPAPPPVPEKPKERIVTEFMLLRKGVPLDFSYNETAPLPGDIISAPGCPKSIDGYPWVLYGDEPKCYLAGQHSSVCEGSAVMSYQKSSYFGVCGCNFQDCIAKTSESDVKGYQLLRRIMSSSSSRYTFCTPPNVFCEEYVYDRKDKRCHILFSQGPCSDNEWLQRDGKGGVECVPRLCPSGKGLTADSEKMLIMYRNVTEDNASCCKPWGGFAVAFNLKKTECKNGESYSEILQKCIVMPFKASSLVIG